MAARNRLNACVDGEGGGLYRPLSKSTGELSSPTRTESKEPMEQPPRPMTSTGAGSSVPQLAERLSMAQRTHSILTALKTRFSRSRSKERRPMRGIEGRRDSTDYAADNSSDHSSSATPQTQSPRHRLFTLQHDSSRGSDPALARENLTSSPKGSPIQQRARSAVRLIDTKKEASLETAVPTAGSSNTTSSLAAPVVAVVDEDQRRREACLRQHSFFQLRVHLKRGKDLVAKDTGGTSDPYVKFKIGGRMLYKSKTIYRNLNPVWDEVFTLPIEDPFVPVHIKVFDYDWGLQDDFMGSAFLDLTKLELNTQTELNLTLTEPTTSSRGSQQSSGSGAYLGEIQLTVGLTPKSQEDKDQYFQRSTKLADVNRRLKSQIWSSVVTVVLIEGKNLLPMDIDGLSDPYVKFRLGSEKYKSKVIYKSLSPTWLEQFDLHLYDDQSQELEITVWDKDQRSKDDFMGRGFGRCTIDLSKFEREKTHRFWQELEDGAGSIHLLLTISGTTASETISDLSSYEENQREKINIEARYTLSRTFHNLKDVGHLTVKVFRAQGLAAADLGGKSDPFCVLELVNARLQTQTEYKTLSPCWQKIFTFNVKDINSVLEVTVYDEDRDHKVEFLGKVAIPLLRVQNGEKKWYALKDKKLHLRAKGNCPQILLELTVIWNPLRGVIRTLNPKEEKYMQPEVKFKRQVFLRNVMRLKAIIVWFIDLSKYISGCFEWESIPRSLLSLFLFIAICYYFEPYMVPIAMLLVFLKNYIVASLTGGCVPRDEEEEPLGDDDDDEEDKDKEEKKSLKERLQAIQEVTQSVQNAIGYIASLGESIKNTFNFTVPYLSWLAIIMISTAVLVLYLVPLRYLIMGWGVNKFARKLVRPHTIPNNEVLDFLSRVPDDESLILFQELGVCGEKPKHNWLAGNSSRIRSMIRQNGDATRARSTRRPKALEKCS
ncbi:multiple C2 and transmembrane domain-containing protein isoform X3 [Neocloeon triangulifer]|uniref:multiple C2 and transmembrane domain-containing protein isoform X3 n=1 Tax=Neocloeon triangulifer TaxID=2078957 RepID=UPI00286ECA89|nr:multiple C2 and transmembrane domain-containing protein isoform X3 [Neocloeon triangulifer]